MGSTLSFERLERPTARFLGERSGIDSASTALIKTMLGALAQATVRTSSILGLRLVIQAATLLTLVRLFTPAEFGTFAGISALAVLLGSLATFGTHLILLEDVSRNPQVRSSVLHFAVPTTLIVGAILLILYTVIALNLTRSMQIGAAVVASIGFTELLLQPLLSHARMERLGKEYTARSELLATLPLGIRLLTAIALWSTQVANPLLLYAYGYLLASLIALIIAIAPTEYRWHSFTEWRLASRSELHYGFSFALMNLTSAGPSELDKTLALKLLPASVAGVYAASARIIGALVLPVVAMMLAAMPRLFRDSKSNPSNSKRLLKWTFAVAIIYGVLLATIIWYTAPVFEWVFGEKYDNIDSAIRWLSFVVPGMSLRLVAGSALMSIGLPWMRIIFEISGLLILIVVSAYLSPAFGLAGMAIALIFSEWTMALIGVLTCVSFARNRIK